MTTIKAFYREDGPDEGVTISTDAEAAALLGRVHADSVAFDCPLLVQMYVEGESPRATPEFGVGVDGDHGVLSYSGRGWKGLWASHNGADDDGDSIEYYYMGNGTPFPANCRIPYDDLVKAVQEFLLDGDRPASVTWQKIT
ncbi:Imm1 family immunity protein [Actinokineospora iranica]|uniref:Immunity protein Imm1 n=1 Tax=Actinokineospora iranica TaxID=1271860 RepID=A0A1G6Z023_9PSEU|nr:Imm1 family immunity protein [Actinokineospora iranica]SDD95257.1 Immunity protein Imm1 [Actinokineospora iranica]